MTREKKFDSVAKSSAIAVLEDELKIRSVVYAEHLSHGGKADCGEEFYLDALKMAIAALREQESAKNAHCNNRWRICFYRRICRDISGAVGNLFDFGRVGGKKR